MKTITEHLKTLPEPYSTLALRRVAGGKENSPALSLEQALWCDAFSWGKGHEASFWSRLHDYAAQDRPELPEIPAFLLAELEPAPSAPACVFEVGKVYQTREGPPRRVVHINSSGTRPVISLRMDGDDCVDASIKHRLDGKYSADGTNGVLDLIPPAPPKRVVALEPQDCPPGSVFRGDKAPPGTWFNPIQVTPNGVDIDFDDKFLSWEVLRVEYEILLPNTKVWQKCEKEVDA